MNNLSVFQFESQNVRILTIDGEPWFVAKDVLAAIGSSTTVTAVETLVVKDLGDEFVSNQPISDKLGRCQEMLLLSEPALTMFVSRSRTELGKALNRWIHSEVLPTIRKTGRYSVPINPPPESQLSSLDVLAQSVQALAQVAQSMADVERRQREQEKAITHLAADTDWLAKLLNTTFFGLADACKEIGTLKQQCATQDTKFQQHEQFLSELKREKEEASKRLEELPRPTVEAPPLTVRHSVRRLVNDFSAKTGTQQSEVWQRLYQEFYYRCGVNLSQRSKRKNQSRLDVIEEMGFLDKLYAIASEVLV